MQQVGLQKQTNIQERTEHSDVPLNDTIASTQKFTRQGNILYFLDKAVIIGIDALMSWWALMTTVKASESHT